MDFGNGLKMRLVADCDLQAFKAVTVGGYQAQPVEATFARAADATEATFLAAFTLGKEAEPPALRIVKSGPDALVLEVVAKEGAHTITVEPLKKAVSVSSPK